jgi:NAD(P)-dependent dehydrogenase (short-subunit alcohol dehydrogenase family)
MAGPLWKTTPQDWAWVFGVNVMGVAHGTRTAMKSGRLTATDVARLTLEAVRQERFYVFTHPRTIGGVEQRLRDIVQGHSPTNPLCSAL